MHAVNLAVTGVLRFYCVLLVNRIKNTNCHTDTDHYSLIIKLAWRLNRQQININNLWIKKWTTESKIEPLLSSMPKILWFWALYFVTETTTLCSAKIPYRVLKSDKMPRWYINRSYVLWIDKNETRLAKMCILSKYCTHGSQTKNIKRVRSFFDK